MSTSVNPNQPPLPLTGTGPVSVERKAPVNRPTAELAPQEVKEVDPPSVEEVMQAAADLSEYLSSASRSLQINVDGELRSPIVTVLDTDTDEVIRQIPSEELVALARFAASQGANATVVSGVLINEEG